jgi:hypothetical protein
MNLGAGLQAIRGFFVSVRSATSRILLNIQVKHTACLEEGPLGRLMSAFLAQNDGSILKLNNFLKKIRIRITHIVRKNRAGREIPRTKAITSLATTNDGNGLQHPPRVSRFGAGSKEVEFFISEPGEQTDISQQSSATRKGKKGKKPIKEDPESSSGGQFISVYNFFRNSKYLGVSQNLIWDLSFYQRIRSLSLIQVCPSSMLAPDRIRRISLRTSAKLNLEMLAVTNLPAFKHNK